MIEVVRLRDMTRSAARRYWSQYGDDHIALVGKKTWREVYGELLALGPDPSDHQIEKVIGNCSWTSLQCDVCRRAKLPVVVDVGAGRGHATTRLCIACIREALVAAEEALSG